MRIYEILSEEELNEIDFKKLAAAGLLATSLGTTGAGALPKDNTLPQPQTTQSQTVTQQEPETQVTLPKDLETLSVKDKKHKFLSIVIPLIKQVNSSILNQRQKVIKLKNKSELSTDESQWINDIFKKYDVKNFEALLEKLDVIPVSIASAQAAIESGWGTSRFAQQAASIYGQRDYSGGGIAPKDATGFTVAKYKSVKDSIKSYMLNLNTHTAYSEFRDMRAQMRQENNTLDPIKLASLLTKYSERGAAYTKDISTVIKSNDLIKYDG